jgi:hypothetical protein
VIVGGHEERPGPILEEFVRLAGGPEEARIVIMTVASTVHSEMEEEYIRGLRQARRPGRPGPGDDRPRRRRSPRLRGGHQPGHRRLLHRRRPDAHHPIPEQDEARGGPPQGLRRRPGHRRHQRRGLGDVRPDDGRGILQGVPPGRRRQAGTRPGIPAGGDHRPALRPTRPAGTPARGGGRAARAARLRHRRGRGHDRRRNEFEVIGSGDVHRRRLPPGSATTISGAHGTEPLGPRGVTLHTLPPGLPLQPGDPTPLRPRRLRAETVADGPQEAAPRPGDGGTAAHPVAEWQLPERLGA